MNRAMDWTSWVSSFCVFLIFFGPTLSAGNMMQDQTQWSTPGSKSSGKVPLSCPTSFCASAKARPDTEIFRISLSIILMKWFFFLFLSLHSNFCCLWQLNIQEAPEGMGIQCCQAARLALTSQGFRVAMWV